MYRTIGETDISQEKQCLLQCDMMIKYHQKLKAISIMGKFKHAFLYENLVNTKHSNGHKNLTAKMHTGLGIIYLFV